MILEANGGEQQIVRANREFLYQCQPIGQSLFGTHAVYCPCQSENAVTLDSRAVENCQRRVGVGCEGVQGGNAVGMRPLVPAGRDAFRIVKKLNEFKPTAVGGEDVMSIGVGDFQALLW